MEEVMRKALTCIVCPKGCQLKVELEGKENDIFGLTRKAVENGNQMPRLYMWCGESDFLLDANIRYHQLLDELGVDHLYEQSEGDHSWRWWDLHIQSALDYLLK